MKKSNYVHALLWASAVVGSFYLETFWYAKIRYIREVSFFDYRLTIIAVSRLIFTISMLLIYKIQERKSKKNMSKEKQIEEMAEDIGKSDFCMHLPKELCNKRSCSQCTAEIIYEAGYRKRKTSEWRITGDGGYGECANCGVAPFEVKYPEDLRPGWAGYCSGCGAKMLGVNNGELLTWDQLSERRARKEALYWAVSQGVCNYCDHSPKCGKYQDDEFPINAPCMVKKRDYLEFYNSEAPKGGAE